MTNKKCLVCSTNQLKPPLKKWIKEQHYLGTPKKENYQNSLYYCSINCLERQFDIDTPECLKEGGKHE